MGIRTVLWIDLRAPNGERIRRSAGTESKTLAQELHDRLKAELWRTWKLGDKPKRSWNEAVVRWLKESVHKATINCDKAHLRWLDRYLRDKDDIGSSHRGFSPHKLMPMSGVHHPFNRDGPQAARGLTAR